MHGGNKQQLLRTFLTCPSLKVFTNFHGGTMCVCVWPPHACLFKRRRRRQQQHVVLSSCRLVGWAAVECCLPCGSASFAPKEWEHTNKLHSCVCFKFSLPLFVSLASHRARRIIWAARHTPACVFIGSPHPHPPSPARAAPYWHRERTDNRSERSTLVANSGHQ